MFADYGAVAASGYAFTRGLIEFFIYFICFVLRMARSVGFLVTRLIMSTQCPLQASGEISLESF